MTRLFSPGRIGGVAIANRVCMAPIGTRYANDEGFVTGRQIDFYATRARGGVGLVIVEATYIHAYPGRMLISDDRYVRGLARLADAIHENGAAAFIQIQTRRGRSDARDPVAPSAVAHPRSGRMPRAITVEEIDAIVSDFARAALRAKAAGFDGIEIHGGSGYLLNEFLSPLANRRADAYGGSIENRARMALDVVARVRDIAGPSLALIYRQCASERIEGGIAVDEAIAFARLLERAGVDAIDVVSGSTVHSPDWIVAPPAGGNVPLAHAIKRNVHIPVIAGGSLDDPDAAERVLAEDKADFVALGKALLADAEWPRKTREGRYDEVRPCVRCMLCTDSRVRDNTGVRCAVEPRTGRESVYPIRKVVQRKRVAVVGGGIAGMQMALVLAERGHEVELYQQGGGDLDEAWQRLADYFERRLAACDVTIQRGAVTNAAELIVRLDADGSIVDAFEAAFAIDQPSTNANV